MSRFYEAMKRALDQQPQSAKAEPPADTRAAQPPALPFDPDATTPVRRDPLDELEDLVHPKPAFSAAAVEALQEPVPLRLAEPPAPRVIHPLNPAYERLIQRLLAFRGGRRHCSLLVVSAVRGEGASTVARNLALALGESNPGSVVLVDANLRAPSHHLEFPTGTADGLANVLSGKVALKDAVREIQELGISVLPSGRSEDSPPHLLTLPALQSVVTGLQSHYDWLIFDGPSVTAYPDASNLAVVADGALLVLRAEKTRWEVAERAMNVLRESGVMLLGGVLNGRRYHIPDFIYRRL